MSSRGYGDGVDQRAINARLWLPKRFRVRAESALDQVAAGRQAPHLRVDVDQRLKRLLTLVRTKTNPSPNRKHLGAEGAEGGGVDCSFERPQRRHADRSTAAIRFVLFEWAAARTHAPLRPHLAESGGDRPLEQSTWQSWHPCILEIRRSGPKVSMIAKISSFGKVVVSCSFQQVLLSLDSRIITRQSAV